MADRSNNRFELARRIVEHEAGASPQPTRSAAGLDAACRRLQSHLVLLLGSAGVAALLMRALHLAQREQPLLAEVTVAGGPTACFAHLTESLAGSTDEEASLVTATLLTHIFDLLVMLLGEDLGMSPIRKLWPHAASGREIQE